MSKNQSAARQQRRLYEKFLKKFHPAQYIEYKSGVLERGRKIHQENVEAVSKAEEARYEEIQNRMILEMREKGKSDEEIDSYMSSIENIMNNCIYGQNLAKEKILEFVGKWITNPNSTNEPLAFIGDKGTGKTTLAK